MIVNYLNKEWSKKQITVILDNKSKACVDADPNVHYLKGQNLTRILEWGYRRAESIELLWTKPAVEKEPGWRCACGEHNPTHYWKCRKCGTTSDEAEEVKDL